MRLSLFLFLTNIYFLSYSYAQNYQRSEEEQVKDQDLNTKMQEYLKKREAEDKLLLEKPITLKELENKNLVEVEPNNILPSDLVSNYALVPYKVRRPRWGHLFTISYSQFNPTQFESDYTSPEFANFEDLYGTASMIEASYTYKWNFILGSIGGEISYGTYANDADDTDLIGNASLSVQIVRLGVRYVADNFMYEPIIAPYLVAGAYSVLYDESQSGESYNGTTAAAGYYGIGALFQLNWLDGSAAVEAYSESGIENTYLFAEAKSYLASAVEKDPDFSTNFDINFGMSLEF